MSGQIKECWGKFSKDDLDLNAGNAEQIEGFSNRRWLSRERAEEEFKRRIKEAIEED